MMYVNNLNFGEEGDGAGGTSAEPALAAGLGG
eukprot:CAMPEP_0172090186 /NCGR_PEP_ID=MMETSP1043-20130122/24222_1 /TAXON_ID=464988 /ORGANISM="Hemiselmis andersenii, Strain CCMP441" /LENGTH=31 /DNA_ID= /DNA_START= /DNA_END= /DNA_ORIENTATION=